MSYPTVVADRAFTAARAHELHSIAAGQQIRGSLAEYLLTTGAPVTEIGGRKPAPPAADTGDKPLAKLTVPQLRDRAEQLGVDLGDARRKADIIAVLETAAEQSADDTGDDTGDGDEDEAEGEGDDDGAGELD